MISNGGSPTKRAPHVWGTTLLLMSIWKQTVVFRMSGNFVRYMRGTRSSRALICWCNLAWHDCPWAWRLHDICRPHPSSDMLISTERSESEQGHGTGESRCLGQTTTGEAVVCGMGKRSACLNPAWGRAGCPCTRTEGDIPDPTEPLLLCNWEIREGPKDVWVTRVLKCLGQMLLHLPFELLESFLLLTSGHPICSLVHYFFSSGHWNVSWGRGGKGSRNTLCSTL